MSEDENLIGTDAMCRIADCSKPWLYERAKTDPNFPIVGTGRHIKAWESDFRAWLNGLSRRRKSA